MKPQTNEQNRAIFVIGDSEVGKTTSALFLGEIHGLKVGNCSDVIYAEASRRMGVDEGSLRAMPKNDVRPTLVAIGDELASVKTTHMVDALVADGVRVISGIRRPQEFNEAKENLTKEGFAVTTIFIENPLKPARPPDSTRVSPADADHVVVNGGGFEDLWNRLNALGTPPPQQLASSRRLIIARGPNPEERNSRIARFPGPRINAAEGMDVSIDASKALNRGVPAVAVTGGFTRLHDMKPLVVAALAAGYKIDVSEPPKGETLPQDWERGGLREILASRSPEQRREACMREWEKTGAIENTFSRMEASAHLMKAYAPECQVLVKEGFFSNLPSSANFLREPSAAEHMLIAQRNLGFFETIGSKVQPSMAA